MYIKEIIRKININGYEKIFILQAFLILRKYMIIEKIHMMLKRKSEKGKVKENHSMTL
jgi:hypothetical protein